MFRHVYARATAMVQWRVEWRGGESASLVVEWPSPGISFVFVYTRKIQGDLMTKKLSQVNYDIMMSSHMTSLLAAVTAAVEVIV